MANDLYLPKDAGTVHVRQWDGSLSGLNRLQEFFPEDVVLEIEGRFPTSPPKAPPVKNQILSFSVRYSVYSDGAVQGRAFKVYPGNFILLDKYGNMWSMTPEDFKNRYRSVEDDL